MNYSSETKRKQNNKTIRKVKRSAVKSNAMILLLVTVFCMFSIVLVYQRNVINDLDTQISTLQSTYKKATMLNDDLQGQLIKAKNLNEVEKYAINTLGMVKPSSNDVSYVSYNTTNANANSVEGKGNFLSLLSALFD